jgi:hypothetical protein
MTARQYVACALLSIALVGCGGDPERSDTPAAPPDPVVTEPVLTEQPAETTTAPVEPAVQKLPDPCVLVTQQEAEALAGTKLAKPAAQPESCTYTGPVTGPLGQVEVYVGPGALKFLQIDRDLNHDLKRVPNTGDEAWIEDGTLFTRVGQVWTAIRVVRLDELAVYRDVLIRLGRTAADRTAG